MKNKNIIVLGQQDWESAIGSNNINIAIEFSKNNKVVYVDNAPDRKTIKTLRDNWLIKKKLSFVAINEFGLEEVMPNLWVLYPSSILESINWLPEGFIYNFFNKINNKRLAKNIKKAARELHFNEFYIFNDSLISKGLYLKEILKPKLYIYYSRDNFSTQPYFQRHAVREERELIAKADIVVANSSQLAQIAQMYNQNSHNIGQGCDLTLYDPTKSTVSPEMQKISKPIIGYTGFLTSLRLDIKLIEHAAISHPEWQIVLIGPEDDEFKASYLHNLTNVHFLGNKNPNDLADYIRAFDVTINPQLVNELTRGNYPRKIDEYLAMGKPVVATKTEFMSYFESFCYLSTDKNSFVQMIEKALSEDNSDRQQGRIAFAQTHSWEKNVEKVYELVAKFS